MVAACSVFARFAGFGFLSGPLLQPRNLALDHGRHFDAQIVAIEQRL
jgi:hypothetical protein